MPKTRFIKKRGKRPMRRTTLKKRIPRPMFMNSFHNGFPPKLRVALKYTHHKHLAPAGNAIASMEFRLNSIFDPLKDTGGDKPRYFDQLMGPNLYDIFLITKCDWSITFVNKAAATHAFVLSKMGNNETETSYPTLQATLYDFRETKYTQSRILTSKDGASTSKVTIKGSTPIYPLIANSKLNYFGDRASFQGKFNANPVLDAILFASVASQPNAAVGAAVDVYVKLRYHCELSTLSFNPAAST